MEATDSQQFSEPTSPCPQATPTDPSTPDVEIRQLPGRELGQQLLEDLADFTSTNSTRVWKQVLDQNGLTLYKTLDINSNRQVFKAEGSIDAPAALVFDLLYNISQQAEWDEQISEARLIEEFDPDNQIVFVSLLSTLPSQPRELVVYRTLHASSDGSLFLSANISVDHPAVPLQQGSMRYQVLSPSGWVVRKNENDPSKCKLTVLATMSSEADPLDPTQASGVDTSGLLITRLIAVIRRTTQVNTATQQKQYLQRIITRSLKEVSDLFMCVDGRDGWKKEMKQANLDLWCKQMHNRDIICVSGIFLCDFSPQQVFDFLMERPPGYIDPLNVSSKIIERLDSDVSIWHVNFNSAYMLDIKSCDTALMMIPVVVGNGVRIMISRSVVHDKVPPQPGVVRLEVLPSGFFIHPAKNGGQSLVSYIMQADMSPYKNFNKTVQHVQQVFAIRCVALINTLRSMLVQRYSNDPVIAPLPRPAQLPEPPAPDPSKPLTNLELLSKLCTAVVSSYDQKERVSQQLRNLDHTNTNNNNNTVASSSSISSSTNIITNAKSLAHTRNANLAQLSLNDTPSSSSSPLSPGSPFSPASPIAPGSPVDMTSPRTPPSGAKRKAPEFTVSVSVSPDPPYTNSDTEADMLPSLQSILSSNVEGISQQINYQRKSFTFSLTSKRVKVSDTSLDPVVCFCNSTNGCQCGNSLLYTQSLSPRSLQRSGATVVEAVPDEILINVLKYLSDYDVCQLAQVNRRFRLLTDDDRLWKNFFLSKYPEPPKQAIDTTPFSSFSWHNSYRARAIVQNNWVQGRYNERPLTGHQKSIRTIVIDNDLVVSGCSDKTVKVWSARSGECTRTFVGPNAGVLGLSYNGSTIITGYRNGVIASWNVNTGESHWEKQFNYWSEGFHFFDEKIVSWDASVDIWDLNSGQLMVSLRGHTKKVTSVEVHEGRYILSGSSDKTVKLWDLETKQCVSTFVGHTAGINAVDMTDQLVLSGGNDRVLKLWDRRTNLCVNTLRGHICPVKCVKLGQTKLVSGAGDNCVRFWDLRKLKDQCTQRFEGHQSPVTAVEFDEKKIVSGGNDGSIILFDFAVGATF